VTVYGKVRLVVTGYTIARVDMESEGAIVQEQTINFMKCCITIRIMSWKVPVSLHWFSARPQRSGGRWELGAEPVGEELVASKDTLAGAHARNVIRRKQNLSLPREWTRLHKQKHLHN
jgi:hypothetical protein